MRVNTPAEEATATTVRFGTIGATDGGTVGSGLAADDVMESEITPREQLDEAQQNFSALPTVFPITPDTEPHNSAMP